MVVKQLSLDKFKRLTSSNEFGKFSALCIEQFDLFDAGMSADPDSVLSLVESPEPRMNPHSLNTAPDTPNYAVPSSSGVGAGTSGDNAIYDELVKEKCRNKKLRDTHRKLLQKKRKDQATVSMSEFNQVHRHMKEKDTVIRELQHENLLLQENVEELTSKSISTEHHEETSLRY
ncbi:Uncharacterised protein at_DN2266 [Pycnogonum litorale]